MGRITNLPRQHPTKVVDFQRLDGGLNLWELDYRLPANQSPDMKNLWWEDGVLQCRDGQEYIIDELRDVKGYACYPESFYGYAVFHIGNYLYRMDLTNSEGVEWQPKLEMVGYVGEPSDGVGGTFFRSNDGLYYKGRGYFYRIKHNNTASGTFSVLPVHGDGAFIPTILLNADPSTCAGDVYQPENRLSPKKIVKYNAAVTTEYISQSGTGSKKSFTLGKTASADYLTAVTSVYIDGVLQLPSTYTVDLAAGKVTFSTAPASGKIVTFMCDFGATVYKLPVTLTTPNLEYATQYRGCTKAPDGETLQFDLEFPGYVVGDPVLEQNPWEAEYTITKLSPSVVRVDFTTAPTGPEMVWVSAECVFPDDYVDSVSVDGKFLAEGVDYAVNYEKGEIVFVAPPPVHDPPVNNTVVVKYSKYNRDAEKAILDCRYATVYGGTNGMCIVMGGNDSQPNAFFWNGNTEFGFNDSYWPIEHYQLAGGAGDPITGFGKQYGTLIVLKERSIGKSNYSIETLNGRSVVSMPYTEINDKIGCDLPKTIQLIEDNIVFCNTSGGVHVIRDSTAALENNIECLSRNVNGTSQRPGLLEAVRSVGRTTVCSVDDDNRYWVCVGDKVYAWDYLLSGWNDPSWFYFTNVNGVAYFRHLSKTYHLDAKGRVTRFGRFFADYGGPIEKVYQFPPQFFGTYDRLKDILHCIFTVRSDTDSVVKVHYSSDYEEWDDMTPIESRSWRLAPRNLAYRCLSVQRFAHTARREPGSKHVRHFAIRLSNNEVVQDLAILSAQIYFRYTGRDR